MSNPSCDIASTEWFKAPSIYLLIQLERRKCGTADNLARHKAPWSSVCGRTRANRARRSVPQPLLCQEWQITGGGATRFCEGLTLLCAAGGRTADSGAWGCKQGDGTECEGCWISTSCNIFSQLNMPVLRRLQPTHGDFFTRQMAWNVGNTEAIHAGSPDIVLPNSGTRLTPLRARRCSDLGPNANHQGKKWLIVAPPEFSLSCQALACPQKCWGTRLSVFARGLSCTHPSLPTASFLSMQM
jgi:hypothetical protein